MSEELSHGHDHEYTAEDSEAELLHANQEFARFQSTGTEERSPSSTAKTVELICPFAIQASSGLQMPTKGKYRYGYPEGVVVHATDGRSYNGDSDVEATIKGGVASNQAYFAISRTGKIYQTHRLDRWGSHAGRSWEKDLGYWLSSKLLGIEVASAGILTKTSKGYEPWWNPKSSDKNKTYYTEDQVRYVEKIHNITKEGYYLKFSDDQEDSLFKLVKWLETNNPEIFSPLRVFGHDEVAVFGKPGEPRDKELGRKQDPGGGLSTVMFEFRDKLLTTGIA